MGLRLELRTECLKMKIFYNVREAQVIISAWRDHYNRVRPHSSLGDRPPAPVTQEAVAQHLHISHHAVGCPCAWFEIPIKSPAATFTTGPRVGRGSALLSWAVALRMSAEPDLKALKRQDTLQP